MLGRAIAIAATAHQNHRDKGGNAYILHPIRIMMRLRTEDEELMQIAILHDVVEDDKSWSIDRLSEEGFSYRVCAALTLLTHDPKEPYQEYIRKIGTNKDATLVKLEDLRDNSDITRLKGVSQKDFERAMKYHKAFVYLKTIVKASETVGY